MNQTVFTAYFSLEGEACVGGTIMPQRNGHQKSVSGRSYQTRTVRHRRSGDNARPQIAAWLRTNQIIA